MKLWDGVVIIDRLLVEDERMKAWDVARVAARLADDLYATV